MTTITVIFIITVPKNINRKKVASIKNLKSLFETPEVEENPRAFHIITAREARDMLLKNGATVVDVRTEEEYAQKHIPGAVLLPLQSIRDSMPKALPDKDAALLVHCRSGVRSRKAAGLLSGLGYTRVFDFGGIEDWKYETESGWAVKNEPTA